MYLIKLSGNRYPTLLPDIDSKFDLIILVRVLNISYLTNSDMWKLKWTLVDIYFHTICEKGCLVNK